MGKSKHDDGWFERERLHRAAEDGDLAEVERLLNEGASLEVFNEIGYTPLHCAVRGEHYKVAQLLLNRDANVDAHESERAGDTPLAVAARGEYPEIAELLLKHGADPDIPGWMAITPRHRAQRRRDEDGKKLSALMEQYSPSPQAGKQKR
jgi:ankyrin repeat protein